MQNFKKVMSGVLIACIVVSCATVALFASSYKNYSMSTSSQTSGSHKYFNLEKPVMEYVFTMSGCASSNDSARIRAYKDEWTYATIVQDDQIFYGNGSQTAWWNIPSTGDFNLELTANASGRTVTTNGIWHHR